MQFKIKGKNKKEIICDVISTYHDDETNKDFIIYTDNSLDKNNKLNIYFSLYKQINNNIQLIDITEIEDKKIGLQLIKELIKDIKK